jgi:hypothetical protein
MLMVALRSDGAPAASPSVPWSSDCPDGSSEPRNIAKMACIDSVSITGMSTDSPPIRRIDHSTVYELTPLVSRLRIA